MANMNGKGCEKKQPASNVRLGVYPGICVQILRKTTGNPPSNPCPAAT